MRHLPVVTTSEARALQRCPRFHFYRYVLGYKPAERAQPLGFGTVVHSGLEAWWRTAGNLEHATAELAAAHASAGLDPYDLIRADVMLTGYHHRWIDEPITVLAVELEFSVPIVHPDGREHHLRLAGKLDALCSLGGRALVPEHKTKSEKVDTVSYFEHLRADPQVSNYLIAAEALGYEPGGALYDVLVKPPEPLRATPEENRRYRKDGGLHARQRDRDEDPEEYRARLTELIATDPDAYYQRAVVTREHAELEAARLDLWHAAEAVYAASSRAYHPRNPDACRQYARLCDFYGVCWEGEALEDSSKYTKLDNPYTELSNATSRNAAE